MTNLMHKFLFYNKFIIFLYMFRALLCSSGGYTASGIITPVGGRPVHSLREDSRVLLNLCTGWPPTGVTIPDAV